MNEGWISFSVDKKTEADEASKSKQRKRSKTTVSIGNMPITSQKKKQKKKKNTFSQFAGNLYEQVDRVTMGSPLVLLMVNAFMCHIEEKWGNQNKMPLFSCQHWMKSTPSLSFTMELENNDRLPYLGMMIIRNSLRPDTKVYGKPTDTGILRRYQSHDETAINSHDTWS